jgi:hypothetical protein
VERISRRVSLRHARERCVRQAAQVAAEGCDRRTRRSRVRLGRQRGGTQRNTHLYLVVRCALAEHQTLISQRQFALKPHVDPDLERLPLLQR